MNKYRSHVIVVPEDDANRQLADGFVGHDTVVTDRIQVVPPAGGWAAVLAALQRKHIIHLQNYPKGHVIALIDFDGDSERRTRFEREIPEALRGRLFVIGSRDEPEAVKRSTGRTFEQIGTQLADECFRERYELWDSPHFAHNAEERARLATTVKSFLFGG